MKPLRQGDPRQVGPYRLEARLGGGGMGEVFLGRSRGGRPVAVKLVRPELADDPGFLRRFALEAEAARRVGGFYTAQVVDADPAADPPWLVTAYISGPSLQQAVMAHGPLPVETVTVLGAGLAEGLAGIHACDLVHRDLKPSNVVLAEDGPRIIDFGITRALDATSHTLAAVGTPGFMSPEQARGREIGPASDVFSLACVLAFAATGRSPFGAGRAEAVVYRVVHDEPDLTGLPARLAGLVRRCLSKDPGERPDLADVLEELAAEAAEAAEAATRWLPPPITTMITEYLPGPPPPPTSDGGRAAREFSRREEHSGVPSQPRPPTPPRPRPAAARPTVVPEPVVGTARAAVVLALLCLPGMLYMIFWGSDLLRDSRSLDWFEMMLLANMAMVVVEVAVLATGTARLSQRNAAGRWMIAAAGGATAVHAASTIAQFFLTGGDPTEVSPMVIAALFVVFPLTAVSAAAAAVMAVLPSTGRGCLPRSRTAVP